jgi:hypothetical protein
MFDFMLGSREEISQDTRHFLVSIKRMLPRWANSLPDSEFHALIDLIELQDSPEPIFVETGVGASTLLFLHYAMARGGKVYSWDMNGSKASFIRSVAAETLEPYHKKALSEHWTFVGSMTLSPHTGLSILPELTSRVDLSMHDSDHTWDTISGEIAALIPCLCDGSIVCVDDANQTFIHTYEPIINITRRKIGLGPIAVQSNNLGEPHYKRLPTFLERHFKNVTVLPTSFEERLKDDPYYSWYSADREAMGNVGMERLDDLAGRFIAMRVAGNKA